MNRYLGIFLLIIVAAGTQAAEYTPFPGLTDDEGRALFPDDYLLVTSDRGDGMELWYLDLGRWVDGEPRYRYGWPGMYADVHSDGCKAPFHQGFRSAFEVRGDESGIAYGSTITVPHAKDELEFLPGEGLLQPAISGSGYLAWVEETETGSELWVRSPELEPVRLDLPWSEVWWPDWYYTFTNDDLYGMEEELDYWSPYGDDPCPIPLDPAAHHAVVLFNALVEVGDTGAAHQGVCYAVLAPSGVVHRAEPLLIHPTGDCYSPDVQAPFRAQRDTEYLEQPLAFHLNRDGNRDVYRCTLIQEGAGLDTRLRTEDLERVTYSEADDRFCCVWGRWIFFASNRNGDWEIFTQPPEGGEPINITNSPDSDEVHCAFGIYSEA